MEEIPNVAPNQGGFPLLRSPQNETQQKSADISGVAQAFLPSVSDMTDPKLLVDPVQQSANDETPPKLPLDGDQQSSIDITYPKLLLDNQQNIVEDPALSSITNVKLPVDKDAQELSGETSHETKLKLPLVYYGTLGHMTLPVGQSSSDRHERERMFKTEHNFQGSFSLENTKPKQAYQSRQKNLSTTESNDLSGFIVVGGSNSAQRNSVYYDVTTKRFQHLKKLNTGRCGAASVKIGSKVFVIGGAAHEWGGKTHQSCEMLELNEHAEWILLPDMLEARNDCRSGFIDGLIYVTGGFNNKGLSSCEAFDIQNNKWLRINNMLHARYAHGLVVLNGSLYCIGGFDDKTPITSCERYDARTGEWNEIASLSQPRHGLGSVVLDNNIYAIGGFSDNGRLATVERYHPEVDRWENASQLQIARSYLSACVVRGTMYAVGGYNKENSNSVEVFDSTSDVWTIGFETEKQIRDATVVAI
uniref:Kelch-like protein 5 n=1 Tax=Phallusia mammillata TaxID=59560 RepID=A0A6F9DGR0_9ASCI|nr:kelch-like protein 5 [Phallusia mammillata]